MNNILDNMVVVSDMNNIYDRNLNWDRFNNKTVLITGAYGMLASYICLFLVFLRRKGINVKILAVGRNYDKALNVFGDLIECGDINFINWNLKDNNSFDLAADFIIHAAGLANPRFYTTNPVEVLEPNIIGTYNLLNIAKGKCESFLFFSSGDVYGKVDNPEMITEDTMGRLDPLDNHSCYGESKRMAETMCMSYYREYNVPIKIARIGHTYSPTMDIENDPRVFASFMRCVVNSEDIVINSDGLACRPFCYIADAVAAYFLILLNGANGEAYNVCNNKEFLSIRELAEIMVRLDSKKELNVIYKKREINDKYIECKVNKDNKPLENKLLELGWNCQYTTFDGMKKVYDFIINN